ncbi:spexin prohormone 2 isoform X2 [Pygocentrus nattereri]|nr:spexin prohormone 2 isoform X2 [Pygocentrus nattereri]
MREAVASINSEGADELYKQACSRHKSAGELRQCNQLDMGQNSSHPLTVLMPPREKTGEKLAVQNGNMCQVVCDVNGGGQMVLLNHCSPSQIIHPMVLGHSVSSAEPPLYTADHPHSPEHCPLQGRGDGPVSQVPGGYTSPPYLSSFTNSNTHPSSNLISTAPGYTFNTMPGPYTSQFHQTPCAARADTVETRHSGAQTVRAWERSKKPCNCTKSQCLKLYCDCFANGEFCSNCKCINCCNNIEHESERYRAIKTCLERNPAAFRPKISNRKLGDVKNRHTKGCNCKRSGCLKNYCECYEAKIMCSSTCKCVGCRNYDGSPVRQHTAWQSPDATDIYSTGSKCPLSCITPDVVEATCGCLLAQAEEAEREGHTRPHAERLILEEFGQCLTQIVRSIFKSTGVQW